LICYNSKIGVWNVQWCKKNIQNASIICIGGGGGGGGVGGAAYGNPDNNRNGQSATTYGSGGGGTGNDDFLVVSNYPGSSGANGVMYIYFSYT